MREALENRIEACPICNSKRNSLKCTKCGYDESTSVQLYSSFVPLKKPVASIRKRKKQLQPPMNPLREWKRVIAAIGLLLAFGSVLAMGSWIQANLVSEAIKTAKSMFEPKRKIIKAELSESAEEMFQDYLVKPGDPDWQKNTLLPYKKEDNYYIRDDVFGTGLRAEEIDSLTFLASLDDAPKTCWDVSAAQDGSVLAWSEKNEDRTDLFIGAEGPVYAPEDSRGLFAGFDNMETITFNDAFSTQNARLMDHMFENNSVYELDLSRFDTSNVVDMSHMFFYCGRITELDLSSFETQSVESFLQMFGDCSQLKELDLSGFDTRNAKYMGVMFGSCPALESINLDGFDTSNVTHFSGMFKGCSSLEKLDLSSFDTSKAYDFSEMFKDCTSLKELDLSGFRTDGLEETLSAEYVNDPPEMKDLAGEMFTNCPPGIGDDFYAKIGLSRADFDEGAA